MHDIEFIRYLIDLIDSRKSPPPPPVIVNVNVSTDGTVKTDTNSDVDGPLDRDDVFIPPLQAKIEMMKKMTGVEPKNQEFIASDDDEPLDG